MLNIVAFIVNLMRVKKREKCISFVSNMLNILVLILNLMRGKKREKCISFSSNNNTEA